MPTLLDGRKVAASIYERVALEISLLPFIPKIVFVVVGDDAASETYVKSKNKKCLDLGLRGETLKFAADTKEDTLVDAIQKLNHDKDVCGILVQLPLPAHLDKIRVLREIDPIKDVDGLHAENLGRLMQGIPQFVPCTPAGCLEILKFYSIPIVGARAVVVGRSEIVGKPMATLLTLNDATVTICHSKTANLAAETSRADILIVAMGKPKFIRAEHVKEGAVVLDVGIHRVGEGLVGDVDFESVSAKAGFISPVPGGVGPMTIAMLMKNLATAAALQSKGKS